MLKIGHELLAERGGVLLTQIDLILGAIEGKPHGLGCRAAIEVVFQRDGHFLGHLASPNCDSACNLPRRASQAAAATPHIRSEIQRKSPAGTRLPRVGSLILSRPSVTLCRLPPQRPAGETLCMSHGGAPARRCSPMVAAGWG